MTLFKEAISEHLKSLKDLKDQEKNLNKIIQGMKESIANGGKILVFANGGNVANAQHLTEKLMGKSYNSSKSTPVISLMSDISLITSLANDDLFQNVFSQQIEALAKPEDVCFGITTSGRKPNILNAFKAAKQIGCKAYGFTGYGTLEFDSICDAVLKIENGDTYAIQENHLIALNIICRNLS